MEILTAIIIILVLYLGIKVVAGLLKTGFFLLLLPFKILLAILVGSVLLVMLPILIIPAFLTLLVPLIPFMAIGFGIVLFMKYI